MDEPRLTYRDVKLAILTILQRDGTAAKNSLLGAPGNPGQLQTHVGRPLTMRERALADDAYQELRNEGLIASSFREPDNRVELTEAGALALETVSLDPLDRALQLLSPHLVDVRAAAWAAVAADRETALRTVAGGPREIVEAVLARVDGTPASEVAARARDLALAVDAKIRAKLAAGEAPSAQDMADAIRVTEIVVRELLIEGAAARGR